MARRKRTSAAFDLNRRRFPRISRYLKRGVFCVICIAAGFAFCLSILHRPDSTGSGKPEVAPSLTVVPAGAELPIPQAPPRSVNYADDLLVSGNPGDALKIYEQFDVTIPAGDAIRYRMALCRESLGDADESVREYQSIIDTSDQTGFVDAARIGLARVYSAVGQWRQALEILYPMILAGGTPDEPVGSALHQLAFVTTRQATPENIKPYEPNGILFPAWRADIERRLNLPLACQAGRGSSQGALGVRVLSRIQNDPTTIRVAIRFDDKPLPSLVEELLSEVSLQLQWESLLRPQRPISLVVVDSDLATVLDGLLEPIGLTWIADGMRVRILETRKLPSDVRSQEALRRAKRQCHNALALFPDHPASIQSYFLLGNIAFLSGDDERASEYYRQILRNSRDLEVLGDTWFNHAKALFRRGLADDANTAFTKVVDHARGRDVEAIAYLYLSDAAANVGDVDLAVKHVVRAVSIAKETEVRQLAVVTLAAAYLMAENPLAANRTLMDHRNLLKFSPFHGNAIFLSSLARLRAASDLTERFHRGRTLTESLPEVVPERFFTSMGVILLGQAYAEIGTRSGMQTVYETLRSDSQPNAMRHQALMELADSYVQDGDVDRGRALYRELLVQDVAGSSEEARLRIAELDRMAGQEKECLEHCRQLAGSSNSRDVKSRALALMGQVYESREDYYKAALCFGGMIPHISTAKAPSATEY